MDIDFCLGAIKPESDEEREYLRHGLLLWPEYGELSKVTPIDAAKILRAAFVAYPKLSQVEVIDSVCDDIDVLLESKRKRPSPAEIKKHMRDRARAHARNAYEADAKREARIKQAAEFGIEADPEDDDPCRPYEGQ